jgi:NADPH:quinone reductase-like Zn-dependent oxidoreductase
VVRSIVSVLYFEAEITGNGTLQQYLKVPSSSAISPKPAGMSWNEAAAIPLVYSTVYGALVEAGQLPFNPTPEERDTRSVLILGGSSGTGNVAIQLAKKMGLKVVTSCSGRNVEFVKGQGADEVRS